MLGFRPKASELYLERSRLLSLLPEEAGYVVWLEAAYGYGKSVLAAQWAEGLEQEGWRIFWLSVQGRDLKTALANLLNLAAEGPWGSLLDALWQEPSLLVLEDLEGNEELNPLLKDVRGLLLLASRKSLSFQELPRLATQGRLQHLQASQLAFTPNEALEIFADALVAKQAWERSQGWSLPLHFAALTGGMPETEALMEGLRESLSEALWQEALLLAALPYLPLQAATQLSKELADKGFAQELESAYRLHPLAAEAIQAAYGDELRARVLQEQERLPLVVRAEAFAKTQLFTELNQLMETTIQLAISEAEGFLRWNALCPLPKGPGRLLGLSWAESVKGNLQTALATYHQVIHHPEASVDQQLIAMAWLISDIGPDEVELAEELIARAQALFAEARTDYVSSFLHNASGFYLNLCDWQKADQLSRQALEYCQNSETASEALLSTIQTYLAIINWELKGDLENLIAVRYKSLEVLADSPFNTVNKHLNLGKLLLLLSDSRALYHLEEAEKGASHHFLAATTAALEKAAFLSDIEPFARLIPQIRAWQTLVPSIMDRLYALWAKTLRLHKQAEAALELLEPFGPSSEIERALCLAILEKDQDALKLLAECEDDRLLRMVRLELQAARYLVSKEEKELELLLGLTMSRDKILPAFIPLGDLPKHRPDLSKPYPLAELLVSQWPEAIRYRFDEIPKLELSLVGTFCLKVLGQTIDLTDRHKAILAMLALGYDREVIGEALWPETDSKKVLNNLHVQLNLLRKLIEPWNLKTYLSEAGLERSECDLWLLQEALEKADAQKVLELYKEPLAPGVDLALLDEARDALRQHVLDLLFEAAEVAKQPANYLERILELDPLFEEALQLLLKDLLKRGRRREAQRRLHSFAARLKREMALEPLAETLALLA